MSPPMSNGPGGEDRDRQHCSDQHPPRYTNEIVSPSAVRRQVALGLGIIRDAAQDRATREISEGGVRRAVDVHDRVLLYAAMMILVDTPYRVVGTDVGGVA
jgi:hypothetical protein